MSTVPVLSFFILFIVQSERNMIAPIRRAPMVQLTAIATMVE